MTLLQTKAINDAMSTLVSLAMDKVTGRTLSVLRHHYANLKQVTNQDVADHFGRLAEKLLDWDHLSDGVTSQAELLSSHLDKFVKMQEERGYWHLDNLKDEVQALKLNHLL